MTDAERAAALADDVVRNERTWSRNGYRIPEAEVDLIVRGLLRLAEQAVPSPGPADLREAVAKAFEECEIGFSLQLVRLVDGVSTYLLSTTDGEPDAEFEDQEGAYAELGRRKAKARSDAVLSGISAAGYVILPREPTEAMIEAACRAMVSCDAAWINAPEPEKSEARESMRNALRAALAAKEASK